MPWITATTIAAKCRVAFKWVLLRFRCKFCAVEGLRATRHFAGWKSFQAVRQPQECKFIVLSKMYLARLFC